MAHSGAGTDGRRAPAEDAVQYDLRVAAAYAWRLIMLGVAVYLVFFVLAKLTLAAVAVFVGLVISALLRPLVDLFTRGLPRGMAVALALLLTLVAFGGIFTFIANSVAGQSSTLTTQFSSGLAEIERSLTGGPFHIRAVDLTHLSEQVRDWLTTNGGSAAGPAASGAGGRGEAPHGLPPAVLASALVPHAASQPRTGLASGHVGRPRAAATGPRGDPGRRAGRGCGSSATTCSAGPGSR